MGCAIHHHVVVPIIINFGGLVAQAIWLIIKIIVRLLRNSRLIGMRRAALHTDLVLVAVINTLPRQIFIGYHVPRIEAFSILSVTVSIPSVSFLLEIDSLIQL